MFGGLHEDALAGLIEQEDVGSLRASNEKKREIVNAIHNLECTNRQISTNGERYAASSIRPGIERHGQSCSVNLRTRRKTRLRQRTKGFF